MSVWILIIAVVMVSAGMALQFTYGSMMSAGDFVFNYFATGRFPTGELSAGTFSIGIFNIGACFCNRIVLYRLQENSIERLQSKQINLGLSAFWKYRLPLFPKYGPLPGSYHLSYRIRDMVYA